MSSDTATLLSSSKEVIQPTNFNEQEMPNFDSVTKLTGLQPKENTGLDNADHPKPLNVETRPFVHSLPTPDAPKNFNQPTRLNLPPEVACLSSFNTTAKTGLLTTPESDVDNSAEQQWPHRNIAPEAEKSKEISSSSIGMYVVSCKK